MGRNQEELLSIKELDIYSLILFALFKLRSVPEYLTLSELVYILDKESLLKLCEYFGGLTLKIPTIQDLESILYSLLLYQYVDINKMEYEDAVKLLGKNSSELRKIKSDYIKLKTVLENYSFGKDNEWKIDIKNNKWFIEL